MAEFLWYQYCIVGLLFVWSGVVRSGFGFGGAVFALPFLLLVENDPLLFLPVIAVHLLFFSSLAVYQNHRLIKKQKTSSSVDWRYLRKAMTIMIIPKLIGVLGLVTLPSHILSAIIFIIVLFYALSYMLNKPFVSQNTYVDGIFLVLGGYISGTSLIGAPLIVAVFARHVVKEKLRDTLFVLWFILVCIKMASFIYYNVDLQLRHHLWLLPCAGIGHVIGLRVHAYLMSSDTVRFYRILGSVLLLTAIGGIVKEWLIL